MRAIFIICGIVVSLIVGLWIWGGIVDNKERQEIKPYVTYTRLMGIALFCDEYEKTNNVWPTSLEQLIAFRPELTDWAKDAWGEGNNMWGRYVVLVPFNKSLGYGEVISYGRDGKPEGISADRDMIVRFPCDANTNWNGQMGAGLKRPQRVP